MKNKTLISLFIIFTIITQLLSAPLTLAQSNTDETEYISLGTTNDAGDYSYFNNHYCYTSTEPKYNNFTAIPKNNYIECYRLDYTNPKRKDYIYLEKTDPDTDCYFDISLNKLSYTKYTQKYYNHILVQGDFKVGMLGALTQLFLFRDSSGTSQVNFSSAYLMENGSLKLNNGTIISDVAKPNVWFNLKVAVNLIDSSCEIYLNDTKTATMKIPSTMKRINMVRLSLMTGTGNIYADNFSVTGLEVPYENGIETLSDVFPDNPQIKDFMQGKIGFHGYGKLMYKNGEKSAIAPEPVYDKDKQELYIGTDTLNKAFDLSLTESPSAISGNGIYIYPDGKVSYNGKNTTLSNGVITITDKMYIPVTDFAKLIGKYAFSHETGIIVISDENKFIDTTGWNYVTFRPDQSAITIFEDIDFLNNFLSYDQPDSLRLEKDFASVSGDYESAHPRILLNQDGFERLKNLYKTDPEYKKIATKVINKANTYLKELPQQYVFDDAMRMYATGARTQNYFMYWGYAYKLTGNQKYVRRAVEELKALDKFPDFNPMHIIDTGMFCMGLACAYDWFYEAYTPEELQLAKRVVFEKCFKSLSDAYYGRLSQATSGNGTTKWSSNYNAVVSGGCLNAAIATIECDPEYNLDMIDNCIRSLEYTLAGLMPGGGWGESVSYWNYTMEFLSYSMASLNTSFGTDYGISKSQGMKESLSYAMACLGIGGMYNYHDSGKSAASLTNSYKTFMYLANTYDIKDAYAMRMYDIINSRVSPVPEDALFYSGPIEDFESVYDKNGTDIRIDGTELFTVRDTYNRDKSQFYFATHFGATWGYHHHCDCGSFVLDMYGTRFADDLGADDYNIENELKYSSYELYRKRGEGHNILILDPAGHTGGFEQNLNCFAPITVSESDGSKAYVISDMSQVYSESEKMNQGYYIDKEKMTITMRNEFETQTSIDAYWFMHTRADIQIDGNKAYLTRDGHTVCLQFETNSPFAELIEMKAEPFPTSPQVPEQNPNTQYKKVAIRLKTGTNNFLTVKVSPLEYSGEKIMSDPLATWSLNMSDVSETQNVFTRDNFSSFGYTGGSEAKGVYGSSSDDSCMYVPVGNKQATISTDSFTAKNRYTVAHLNIAPYRTIPSILDNEGNNLLENVTVKNDRWNSIWAIYDSVTKEVVTAVNGTYSDRQPTLYNGNSAQLVLTGTNPTSNAYVDNYSIYTSNAIPDIGYISLKNSDTDGYFILSDGTLTPDDIRANGTVRVYSNSNMTTQLAKGEKIGEGAVVVITNNDQYIYYTVTLQKPVSTPTKYYHYTEDFNKSTCVRCTFEIVDDPAGLYGKAIEFTGTEETESNYYLNLNLPSDNATKQISIDIYPTDSVSGFKFGTNGHKPMHKQVISSSKLIPNQWNNVRLVIDPLTNTNSLYINGAFVENYIQQMEGRLRVIFYTEKESLDQAKIYTDNIVVIGGNIPTPTITTSYVVNGNVITGASGNTYGKFKSNFITDSYKFNYAIYNRNGILYNNDTIDKDCILYMYCGDILIGKYTFK